MHNAVDPATFTITLFRICRHKAVNSRTNPIYCVGSVDRAVTISRDTHPTGLPPRAYHAKVDVEFNAIAECCNRTIRPANGEGDGQRVRRVLIERKIVKGPRPSSH